MNTASLLLTAVLLAPAADLKIGPADWPQWRGPNRDGVSPQTGLLKEWPKDGPKRLWTVEGAGGGYSSPSVAGGFVFGTGRVNGKEVVWCRTEKDGKPVWSSPVGDARKVGYDEGMRSTPTVAGGLVYCVTVGGDVVAVTADKGEEKWRRSFTKEFDGQVQNWGYCESVLVDGDRVICTPGSAKAAVVALKAADGAEIWRTPVANPGGAQGYSSPVKTKVGDAEMYVVMLGKRGGVVGVDAKTGKLLWQYTKIMNGTANIPTPVVRGDLVWASTGYGDGGSALIQIVGSGNTFEAKEVKRYGNELQNHHGGVVLVGDHLYFGKDHGQGHPTCVEFKTGEVVWKESQGVAGGNGSAAVVAADGMLVYNYQNGKVVLMAADPAKLDVKGSFDVPQWSKKQNWAHPVIANGKLYLRDQDKLHCFDVLKPGS